MAMFGRRVLTVAGRRLQLKMFCSVSSASNDFDTVPAQNDMLSTRYTGWIPVDIYKTLENLSTLKYEHPADHPKILIRRMEKAFIEQLLELCESNVKVTVAQLMELYEHAIQRYETNELPPQLIVDILTNFLALYSLPWIRHSVIPLVPEATQRMNKCSQRVLWSCIAAYFPEEKLSPDTDKFVCQTYQRFVKEYNSDTVSFYNLLQIAEVMRTVILRSSR